MENRKEIGIFSQNKILYHSHISKINDWINKGTTMPVTVEIDLTNKCNNICPQCAGERINTNASLEKDIIEKTIKEMSASGVKGLIFTGGGEPLLHLNAIEMITYAKQSGMDVALISNGLAIKEDDIPIIVDNCTWLRISLDAATPEMYQMTHGLGKKYFSKILKNIAATTDYKKRKQKKCTIGLGFLTGRETIHEMTAFTKLGKRLGVDYVQFRPFHYDRTGIETELEKCSQLTNERFQVLSSAHKYEVMKEQFTRRYNICYGHHFASVIGADAKMYLCCHMRGKEKYCIGNLKKKSFKEIWCSEEREKAYKTINFKDCPPMCRCDTFNEILWNIKKEKTHVNFL